MTTATTKSGDGSGPAAGFVGSLADTPLAEVLRTIAVEELTGELQVRVSSAIKTVYFDRGFVVFASSNIKSDRLGERMIEAGRISRHEFALASMLMKTTKQKFGKVLVEAGIVAEEELGRHVAAQVNRIVLSLFAAKKGTYSFDQRPCTIPVALMVSLSVYRILIEGVRRMSSKKLVLSGLPALETELRIVDQPPFTLNVDKLRPEEKAVLRAASRGASIRDVVDFVGGHEGVALRACYGLLSGSVLETVEPDPPSRIRRVQEETGTFVLSEIRRKAGVTEEPALPPAPPASPEPESVEPAVTPVTPAEETARDMPEEEAAGVLAWVAQLWNALRGWFAGFGRTPEEPLRLQLSKVDATPPPASELPVVKARPARATGPTPAAAKPPGIESVGVPSWSMKDDPVETTGKAEVDSVGVPSWSLESNEGSEPSTESVGVPSWSIMDSPSEPAETITESHRDVDVSEHAEEGLLDAMDSELFIEGDAPDDDVPSMMSQIPVEEIELDEDSLDLEIEVEVEVEVDEEAVAQPAEPETNEAPTPSTTESTTPARAEYEPAPEPTATAYDREMRRMKQSGGEARLLRDVKLHFKMRDWQGAVPLLEQLVAISPGGALYRGMLARALSRNPATRKDAEEHYIEALRLSPQDPELHYWLGLYYKSFGLKSRAITEFRTTLRINPRHEGARKQLIRGGKKDDVLGNVMKKIFG